VSSVASFVGADPQPQQCEIVDKEAFSPSNPSPGCCQQANRCTSGQGNPICNCRGNVGIVLGDYNLTADQSGKNPTASDITTIKEAIDACSVVVIQVVDRTHPGIEHVMVITGYSDDDTVYVADPAEADTQFTYSYSALLSPMPGGPNNPNWQLVKLFTAIPGTCSDG
jgi:hypothetical protein